MLNLNHPGVMRFDRTLHSEGFRAQYMKLYHYSRPLVLLINRLVALLFVKDFALLSSFQLKL